MAVRSASRIGFALGAAICAALLGYGFVLQYHYGQDPCPLCLVQRGFYFALLLVFLLAAIHGPKRAGAVFYGLLALLFAVGGTAVAARQVWLQHLPPDQVPKCGPGLSFMLDNYPLGKVFANLIRGTGECAEVKWRFVGLSIAEWSLAWFVVFVLLALWVLVRRGR